MHLRLPISPADLHRSTPACSPGSRAAPPSPSPRHAGRSRVEYAGRNIAYHLFTKDFFISVINQKTYIILGATALIYIFVFFFFSIWWYLIVR